MMQQPVKYYRGRSIGKLTSRDSVQLLCGTMCDAVHYNVDGEEEKMVEQDRTWLEQIR
jgi:hypothetical protein